MKLKPRQHIWDLISRNNTVELLQASGQLHGHFCPGLALGVRAGTEMVRRLQVEHEGFENVIAVVETNNCFSDGIQFTTGCTFGNNALIYRDYGKTAASLVTRAGKGFRASLRPDASDVWKEEGGRYRDAYQKVVTEGNRDQESIAYLRSLSGTPCLAVIGADLEDLFEIQPAELEVPEYAKMHRSVSCDRCGERAIETRIVCGNGDRLCVPCANAAYGQLNGNGISRIGDPDDPV